MRYREGRRDEDIGTILRVPNDPSGKAFLKQLRGYATRGTRVRVRGRGPRVMHATSGRSRHSLRQEIPQGLSEYLAVYIDKETKRDRQAQEQFRQLYEQAGRVPQLEKQMQALSQTLSGKRPVSTKSVIQAFRKFRFEE